MSCFSWKETYPHQPTSLVSAFLTSGSDEAIPRLGRPHLGPGRTESASPTPTPPPDAQHHLQLGNPVLTNAGTENRLVDLHQTRRRSPRPTSPLLPRGVLPPAAQEPEPSPGPRGPPASNTGARACMVSSWAASSRASQLFLREKLSESLSQSRQEQQGCAEAVAAAKCGRRGCTKSRGCTRTCGVAAVALI